MFALIILSEYSAHLGFAIHFALRISHNLIDTLLLLSLLLLLLLLFTIVIIIITTTIMNCVEISSHKMKEFMIINVRPSYSVPLVKCYSKSI